MSINTDTSRSARQQIMTHLLALRENLAQARDALMHFKADRVDRDKLERSARRVDDLMNMFASTTRNAQRGLLWITEIQAGVDQATNPKSANALADASIEITALRDALGSEGTAAPRGTK